MAEEAWIDEEGKFHFDNNSGTFKPKKEHVDRIQKFFQEHLRIEDVEGHIWTPPSSSFTKTHLHIMKLSSITATSLIDPFLLILNQTPNSRSRGQ